MSEVVVSCLTAFLSRYHCTALAVYLPPPSVWSDLRWWPVSSSMHVANVFRCCATSDLSYRPWWRLLETSSIQVTKYLEHRCECVGSLPQMSEKTGPRISSERVSVVMISDTSHFLCLLSDSLPTRVEPPWLILTQTLWLTAYWSFHMTSLRCHYDACLLTTYVIMTHS